ncbi:MAG TPA: tetratricopeptide repeat protein [Vicinamibacteria bacterium]|nr:tetratricopeptide repeat protein [Vicinamibacteria bacterium]
MGRVLGRVVMVCGTLAALGSCRREPAWIPLTTESDEARKAFVTGVRDFHLMKMTSARAAFEKALANDAALALGHAYRAITLNGSGDWPGALAEAERLGAQATEAERLLVQATRAWVRGDHDGAIAALTRLRPLAPKDPAVPFRIGLHHHARRRFAEAAAGFEQSIALRPEFAPGAIFAARAYALAGRAREARAAADRAVSLVPKEPLAHFASGEVHERAREWDKAIAAYGQALALDPAFVPAALGRAQVFRETGDVARARQDYEAALARVSALPDRAYKEHFLEWTRAEDIEVEAALMAAAARPMGE